MEYFFDVWRQEIKSLIDLSALTSVIRFDGMVLPLNCELLWLRTTVYYWSSHHAKLQGVFFLYLIPKNYFLFKNAYFSIIE